MKNSSIYSTYPYDKINMSRELNSSISNESSGPYLKL